MVEHLRLADPPRTLLTEAALCAWVGRNRPGDWLAYHEGFLSVDTGADSPFGTAADRQELRRVADCAWQLAQDGVVHLVQRRHGDADYTYFVVARPRPRLAGGAAVAVLERSGLSDVRRSA